MHIKLQGASRLIVLPLEKICVNFILFVVAGSIQYMDMSTVFMSSSYISVTAPDANKHFNGGTNITYIVLKNDTLLCCSMTKVLHLGFVPSRPPLATLIPPSLLNSATSRCCLLGPFLFILKRDGGRSEAGKRCR